MTVRAGQHRFAHDQAAEAASHPGSGVSGGRIKGRLRCENAPRLRTGAEILPGGPFDAYVAGFDRAAVAVRPAPSATAQRLALVPASRVCDGSLASLWQGGAHDRLQLM